MYVCICIDMYTIEFKITYIYVIFLPAYFCCNLLYYILNKYHITSKEYTVSRFTAYFNIDGVKTAYVWQNSAGLFVYIA